MQPPSSVTVPPTPPWYQFRLSYLLYLLTLCAVAVMLFRPLLSDAGSWQMTAVATVYAVTLTLYLGIRIPLLVRRERIRRAALAERRRRLTEWTEHVRSERMAAGDAP